jgi:glycerophosphoryl diester phosphodiesterase
MAKVIAHRGFSGQYPENTLLAFAKAIEAGAEMIELDVHLSKDEQIVVIHDLDLERTTDGTGPVDSYTLAELRRFNAAKLWPALPFQPIPTLSEVLALTQNRIQVNIELKLVARHRHLAELVAQELGEWGDPDQFLFSSFEHEAIGQLRRSYPQYRGAILYSQETDPIAKAKAVDAQALHPAFGSIDESGIAKAHSAGLEVNAWTINDEPTMKRFLKWQVDGIITNHPDKLLALRSSWQ